MKICGKALPPRAALLLVSDWFMFFLALPLLLAFPTLLFTGSAQPFVSLALLARLMLVGLLCQMIFYYNELYNLQVVRSASAMLTKLLQGTGMLLVFLAVLYTLLPGIKPDMDSILIFAPVLMVTAFLSRLIALPKRRERLMIVGSGNQSGELLEVIATCPEWNLEVAQIVDSRQTLPLAGDSENCLSPKSRTYETTDFDRVIVCADRRNDPLLLHTLLDWKMKGICVEDATTFYEQATGRVRVDYLQPEWFVFSNGFQNGRQKRVSKRVFDLLVSTLLLIPALPVMALVALAIRVEGYGSIFFSQDRIGLNGKRFRIYKFRTMRPEGSQAPARWVSQETSRITKLGSILRKFRLDELPQLFNIMRGEMSIVGPRPEQPFFCELLAEQIPYYHQRHAVPPGLTGWAQVRYHYGASVEESKRKLEFDLFYVKHLSLWLDFAVLIETVKVVLVGRGSR